MDWVRRQPNVVIETAAFDDRGGWNVKPSLLVRLLEQGLPAVIWIDSDIIITRPISGCFSGPGAHVLNVAPEAFFAHGLGSAARARDWGIQPVRAFPLGVNTSVVRVTREHLPLLQRWGEMLTDPAYLSAQQMPFSRRSPGFAGDQDVLVALLSGPDFADIEVRSLRLGRDIAQCFFADGFGPIDRLAHIGRLPPFVHAQGPKPWREDRHKEIYLELSPYRYAAMRYREHLSGDEAQWLVGRSPAAVALHWIGLGDASLAGLLPAIVKRARRMYRRSRPKVAQ